MLDIKTTLSTTNFTFANMYLLIRHRSVKNKLSEKLHRECVVDKS